MLSPQDTHSGCLDLCSALSIGMQCAVNVTRVSSGSHCLVLHGLSVCRPATACLPLLFTHKIPPQHPATTGGTVQEAAEAVDAKGEEMQRKSQQHQGQEKLKEDTPGMSRDKL